jgi:NAD+ diphosphatase
MASVKQSEGARLLWVSEGKLLCTGTDLLLTAVEPDIATAYLGKSGETHFFSTLVDCESTAPSTEGEFRSLREIGSLLSDLEAGLAVSAVALQNWHRAHTHCPRCGAPTEVAQAGWVRRCPSDLSLHFPRTDPAVIVAVTDSEGRLLLARQVAWAEHQYSVLAGFCEPGESLEETVRREVLEEVGVPIAGTSYLGSQPWPFPASLMVAFAASGEGELTVDGEEIAVARWFSRAELALACDSGEVRLPPRVSIAHRMIEQWWAAPLPDHWLRH